VLLGVICYNKSMELAFFWSKYSATSKKDEQKQDAQPAGASRVKAGKLHGLPEVRPGEAASRRV
jgi:hypothetical protein